MEWAPKYILLDFVFNLKIGINRLYNFEIFKTI